MTTFRMLALWAVAASLAFAGALDWLDTHDTAPVLKHGPRGVYRSSRDVIRGMMLEQLLKDHKSDETRGT